VCLKYFLLTVTLAVVCSGPASAQISPGPLSHAHQNWDTVTQCSSCHDFGARARSYKCLECHVEIRQRLDAHTGLHARVYKSSAGQTDCVRCHTEHNGATFTLVRMDRKGFDHAAQTGFKLEGKHATQACEKCHTEKNLPMSARPQIKLKDLNRSFLGLRRECTNCHEDAHRGQEGAECSRCHQQDSWKSAPGFNHATTAFPLTGRHQAVACEKCHKPGAEEKTALFKGVAYNGCQNCHNDPHGGAFREVRFQGSCENCHNTSGWKNNNPSGSFNHNTTKFKLEGKHAELACGKCHKDDDFHRPVAHVRCGDCHEDPHNSQFVSRLAGSDCSSCHNQTSYKPAIFDREAHGRSAFPLEGKHYELPCANCHPPAGRGTVYITRKVVCSACHADQHAGQFASLPWNNKCDSCHVPTGFQPSTFSVARHAETKFMLTGQHASVACSDCHKPISTAMVWTAVVATNRTFSAGPSQYHFTSETCNACHSDPHQTKLSCDTCHITEAWKTVQPFDHSTTKFALDGAHQKVTCTQCHVGTPAKLAGTPKQCSACHAAKDPHGGQFRNGDEEDCSSCHVTAQWKNNVFGHDRARFTLDVAHRNVACEKCHKEQTNAAGATIRVYRATPTECVK